MASPSPNQRRRLLSLPEPSAISDIQVNHKEEVPTEKRIGTIYDAVAGEVSPQPPPYSRVDCDQVEYPMLASFQPYLSFLKLETLLLLLL